MMLRIVEQEGGGESPTPVVKDEWPTTGAAGVGDPAAAAEAELAALEKFFLDLSVLYSRNSWKYQKRVYFWKLLAFVPVPLATVAWIFGALALDTSTSSASGITLFVIGACTMFIDRLKPRKYLVHAKTTQQAYATAVQKIVYTLSLPVHQRKPPDELLAKVAEILKKVPESAEP